MNEQRRADVRREVERRRLLDLGLPETPRRRRAAPTSAVSFWSPMKSFSSGGIDAPDGLRKDHVAERLPAVQAERAGGRLWLGCTDSIPAR